MISNLGYEIKGEMIDGSNGKYIQFKPQGKERFVRGYENHLEQNIPVSVLKSVLRQMWSVGVKDSNCLLSRR